MTLDWESSAKSTSPNCSRPAVVRERNMPDSERDATRLCAKLSSWSNEVKMRRSQRTKTLCSFQCLTSCESSISPVAAFSSGSTRSLR